MAALDRQRNTKNQVRTPQVIGKSYKAEKVAMNTSAELTQDFTLMRTTAGNSELSRPLLVASLKTVAASLARGHDRRMTDQYRKNPSDSVRRMCAANGGFSDKHRQKTAPQQNYVSQEGRDSCLAVGSELGERNGESNMTGCRADPPDKEKLHDTPDAAVRR